MVLAHSASLLSGKFIAANVSRIVEVDMEEALRMREQIV